MNTDEAERDAATEWIIGCAFMVTGTPGRGFREKVQENARALALRAAGLAVEPQRGITVTCKGVVAGE